MAVATQSRSLLTERQRVILDFIRAFRREHGLSPTVREIQAEFGIVSPNGVMCHIRGLVAKGYITAAGKRSRAWLVLDDDGRPLDDRPALLSELLACCRLALEFSGPMGPGVRARMARAVAACDEQGEGA